MPKERYIFSWTAIAIWLNDAVENAVKIFLSDRTIGAVTAHGRVRGAENGSTLKKLQDVWYDGQYRIIKGMESSFSSLTCCSGALTGFRRAAGTALHACMGSR